MVSLAHLFSQKDHWTVLPSVHLSMLHQNEFMSFIQDPSSSIQICQRTASRDRRTGYVFENSSAWCFLTEVHGLLPSRYFFASANYKRETLWLHECEYVLAYGNKKAHTSSILNSTFENNRLLFVHTFVLRTSNAVTLWDFFQSRDHEA